MIACYCDPVTHDVIIEDTEDENSEPIVLLNYEVRPLLLQLIDAMNTQTAFLARITNPGDSSSRN